MAFSNASYCLTHGVGLRSKVLLTLIAAHYSRAWLRPLVRAGLWLSQDDHGEIWVKCRATVTGRPVTCGFRLTELASDTQTFFEIVKANCYGLSPRSPAYEVVVDAGGNTGLFSVLAHQLWPDAGVVLFEPNPANQAFLERHLLRNDTKVDRRVAGLGAKQGMLKFYIRQSNRCSLDATDDYSTVIDVNVEKLSGTLEPVRHKRILLKLDVEGAELEVLGDVLPLRLSDLTIVGELHDRPRRRAEFEALLRTHGYVLRYQEEPGDCVLFTAECGRVDSPRPAQSA